MHSLDIIEKLSLTRSRLTTQLPPKLRPFIADHALRGRSIHACKDERKGDFSVGKMTLEIGGRNKAIKGADFVLRDDTDVPGKKTTPLWSLGMMY